VSGRLVLCPTPIGHLADITLRALEELRAADLILAEDTRRTAVLLRHYGIRRPVLSCHDHNEADRVQEVLSRLAAGERLVLVSDAGMPGISDPGYRLVQAAIGAGAEVTALPGPSAILPALVLSGLPTARFAFLGFVPRQAAARASALREALALPLTTVWFESPARLAGTLAAIRDLGHGQRPAAVVRELTKVHEEVLRGSVAELAERYAAEAPRGEIVLVLGPAHPQRDRPDLAAALREVEQRRQQGESLSRAVAAVAAVRGISRRALYAAALQAQG
jgi:16S rRNA (cytidine1402-2'-O)-methyltransferase